MTHRTQGSSWSHRPAYWEGITAEQWSDSTWQHQNRVRRVEDAERVLNLSAQEREAWRNADAQFHVAMTPHYVALMDPSDPYCPVRRQAIPHADEMHVYPFELEDPLAEEAHMPVPGITHRYPDRVLFYVSHHCPVYCRHCTRKRKVSDPTTAASTLQLEQGLAYIRETPRVRDVLISGGDPLTLSDKKLGYLLEQLRQIEHVEVIRLGSRNPVTLPQRITPELCEVLKRARPIYFHTHFNHPNELGDDARRALSMLLDAGCVLGNQMVLMRGINDDPEVVMTLCRELLKVGCRPYYMLQCDMAQGITHFRTPLSKGLEIQAYLRGRLSGMGIPHFVVDLPGGGGKVELAPDTILSREPHEHGTLVKFRNWAGDTFDFVDVEALT